MTARYDDKCTPDTVCTINVPIEKDMDGPVYFYYKLSNFYQNHRRYVKSRSDEQLAYDTTHTHTHTHTHARGTSACGTQRELTSRIHSRCCAGCVAIVALRSTPSPRVTL